MFDFCTTAKYVFISQFAMELLAISKTIQSSSSAWSDASSTSSQDSDDSESCDSCRYYRQSKCSQLSLDACHTREIKFTSPWSGQTHATHQKVPLELRQNP